MTRRLSFDRVLDQLSCIEKMRLGQSRPDQLQACHGRLRTVQGHGKRQRRVTREINCHGVLQLKHLRFEDAYSQVE